MDFKQFCGDEPFFDSNKVLNTTNPKFSHCFEKLVFDLGPCVYLWVFSIPYFLMTRNSYHSHIPVSALFRAKLLFTFILWALTWVDLGRGIWEWYNQIQILYVDLVTPLIVGVTMTIASFFIFFDRLKGVRSSGLLTIFWILFILTWALVFRTKVEMLQNGNLSYGDMMRVVTFFISYACVIAHFIMSFFVDLPQVHEPRDPFGDERTEEEIIADMKRRLNTSPEVASSFISRMFFEWFSKMIMSGYKHPVVEKDLWDLNREDKSGRIAKRFLKIWNAEKDKYVNTDENIDDETATFESSDREVLIANPSTGKKVGKPSLFKAMARAFGPYYLLGSLLKVINDLLTFVSPQLLSAMIAFTSAKYAPVWQGYVLAVLLFVTAILQSIVLQQYFHICFTVGMRMRSAVVAAVYKKAMVLSNAARKESTIGEVVNLMSVDAQRFMDLMTYLNTVWSGPFQITLAIYFLWQTLGASVLAGLGVMLFLIPINALIARKTHQLQVKQMKLKDERIKLMNEILNGIKVLKMYAWEMSFKEKVQTIRDKELSVLRTAAYLNAVGSFTWVCAPFLVSLTSFAVYVLSDKTHALTAQKAFVSLSLFNILRFPLVMLPAVIAAIVQASVSLNRLSKFLGGDELDPDAVDRSPNAPGEVVEVEDATFTWSKDEEPILKDINMSVPSGSLVAIVGQVGSGKSSLISALLGDMEKKAGNVAVKGSIAYVAQQAWIQNLTVQDNVLFGKPLDACLYQQTIEACELKEDFDMLPAGDQTEIGERGINLSGGQKQRVSIARAVYQDSDVYLFDDPLSAVDAHVGKNIFDNVLGPRGCLRKKTRLLVTHGVSFLPQVDKIIVLVSGRISEVGNYDELLEKNGDFAEFLRNYAQQDSDSEEDELLTPSSPTITTDQFEPDVDADEAGSADTIARRKFQRQSSRKISFGRQRSRVSSSENPCRKLRRKKTDRDIDIAAQKKKEKENKLMTTETAETGNIKFSVVVSYMRSVGYLVCFIIAMAYALQNAAQVYSSIWLSDWSNDPQNPDGTQNGTALRLGVYGALGMTQALMVLASAFSLSYGSVIASTILHSKMLVRIFRAPMSFFDTTPLGRIVNRFSKDIYLIDEVIPRSFTGLFMTGFQCLSTFVVIVYSTPIFAAVVVPLLILYYFVQRFYIRTSRQLKRLESISRSPIYSHFSETIAGVSTIRAYGLQKGFTRENELKLDTNQMAYYPNITSNRWLALRLEIVGNLIVLFAAVFAVVEKNNGSVNAGVVGLSISYALQVTMMLNWLVRQASELETNIVAVERVEEYSAVDQEAPLTIESTRPPSNWPTRGEIKFEHYSTRYREGLDLVVKDISVNILGGEKVGIVGRTGAGKSSLTLALFRIIESAGGQITIDGKQISTLGLEDLRSKLSIIPQDPVLFSGSLRMNLDPFDQYEDNELWDALEHSHLKDYVVGLPNKLENEVSEGGENLSVGQRQLVCLARALLRKSKILVLDEATAAVDLETDDLIQATIRVQFSDCTTFTIAHRLNTIMDSTRVLVLDNGRVAEFDTPENLLEAKGIFYSMAKDAGLAS
ncbi:multidrug resistance-associated protein 1-like [Ciona intestinalis]